MMYFWLSYWDENHVEKIPITVKNLNHLFHLASETIGTDRLHLVLLSDSTRIDEDCLSILSSLEGGTELIVCIRTNLKIVCLVYLF